MLLHYGLLTLFLTLFLLKHQPIGPLDGDGAAQSLEEYLFQNFGDMLSLLM